ncbi:MarR family winged helix-turn-helix transcriptional regulator [Arenibaculum sp.]|jgi:DNA-binding MarR family transcriptional regulator|uniref:MarR family winged helix-turn-helix transcriptional regulator n=1 Tax=Arenibaculum sp. TaxID=2865862 RepID=UPI002E0F2014|nr:MarR family winged helix-turn-helix transcriptional regulator [Arenibaculum sp.]
MTEGSEGGTGRHVVAGLAKIGMALRSRAWREGERLGLTPTQAQALGLVRARAPRPVRLSQVADDLQVTQATASDAVSALVRKGLLSKDRAPDDARAVALRLTAAGEAAADGIAEWPDFLLRSVDALDECEQAAFLRGLVKMIRDLQVRGDIPVARMCVTCRFFRPHVHDDPRAPHHCGFVDAPLGDRDLRIDCPEQEQASPGQQEAAWDRFVRNGAA